MNPVPFHQRIYEAPKLRVMASERTWRQADFAAPTVGVPASIVVAAGWTLANYVGWLGLDQRYGSTPSGAGGPYEAWQVIGLASSLSVVAAVIGARGRPFLASSVMAVVMTVCFSVDAASVGETDTQGLWPIGATYIFFGVYGGIGVVAYAAVAFRHWRTTVPADRPPGSAGG